MRAVAASFRTRLAAALVLAMLIPLLVVALTAAIVVPRAARSAAQSTAERDAASAALALSTRCEAVRQSATALAQKVSAYAMSYSQLQPSSLQQMAGATAGNRPGLAAAIFAGSVVAVGGSSPDARLAATSMGYQSSCGNGSFGRRADRPALAQTVPVKARRDGQSVDVGTVVVWQGVDGALLRGLATGIGSTGSLRVLPPSRSYPRPYISGGLAYAVHGPGPGVPFGVQAIQPVRGAPFGHWLLAAVTLAALLALLLVPSIAARLIRPLAALTGTANRLRNGDLTARAGLEDDGPAEVSQVARALDAMASELQVTLERHEEAQRLSVTDALTGVGNLRHMWNTLSHEAERAQRFGGEFSVLMLDLDHFKQVNDTLGHEFGDAVLREFAARLRSCLRELDTVTRYGGEEFVLVLPGTGLEGASTAAERVVQAVRARAFGYNGVQRQVTVSAGVASFPLHARVAEDLLRCADHALYAAKAAGRDRWLVVAASDPAIDPGPAPGPAPELDLEEPATSAPGGR